jgi:helicase
VSLLNSKDLQPQLSELTARVEKGVKAELLPLVRLERVGRVRARVLHDAGLKTIADLKRAPVDKLVDLPLIGTRLAKRIKEQVGGFVRADDWEKLKREEAAKQKALTEY